MSTFHHSGKRILPFSSITPGLTETSTCDCPLFDLDAPKIHAAMSKAGTRVSSESGRLRSLRVYGALTEKRYEKKSRVDDLVYGPVPVVDADLRVMSNDGIQQG